MASQYISDFIVDAGTWLRGVGRLKRIIVLFTISCFLCMTLGVVSAAANQTVFPAGVDMYTLNGQQQKMDAVNFIENGRVYVPVRYLANACGLYDGSIVWDAPSQTVTLQGNNQMLSLQAGNRQLVTAAGPVEMDVVPQVIGGRIYLPARWVAQYFGYIVEWDEPGHAVLVYLPGDDKPQVTPTQRILLVNKLKGLPQDYQPSLLVNFGDFQVSALLQQPLQQLYQAAAQQGIPIAMTSAYRSYAEQKTLFDERARLYGVAVTEATVGQPGYSEHETGLAVDIGGSAVTYRWLETNGPRFGFVLRYPRGKESITGYAYEPWHYRYLGMPVATFMQAKGILTLEEYLHIY